MTPEAKSLTIVLQDASQAQIVLSLTSLTGGQWEAPPIPGTIISPTNTPSYINYGVSAFDSIGGSISLSPASGGQVTIIWSWPAGAAATASVQSQSLTGLAVTSALINTQTMTPQLQVMVSNAVNTFSTLQKS